MYIIAKAGVNHNGQQDRAHDLIEAAALAGANAIKFQTFRTSALVAPTSCRAAYQSRHMGLGTQAQLLQRLELPFQAVVELKAHAETLDLDFISTPFDLESAAFLCDLGVKILKIGSGDVDNLPLLLFIGQQKCNMILSSGMSYLGEIENALGAYAFGRAQLGHTPSLIAFKEAYARSDLKKYVSLLHCTDDYPAQAETLNLKAITTLQNAFGLKTGFSDHAKGDFAAILSLAFGAEILEKHLTLDNDYEGSDHKSSLNPEAFRQMVVTLKAAQLALGTGHKKPIANEVGAHFVARKRLVAAQPIKKGEYYTFANLIPKRALQGADAGSYFSFLGKRALKNYEQDEGINF